MKEIGMLVFDVETGGLNPYDNGLITIGLKVYGRNIEKNIVIVENPGLVYDPRALQINKLSKADMVGGVSEEQAVTEIVQFVKENFNSKPNLLAHNIIFDVQFMNNLFRRAKHNLLFTDYFYYHPKDTMIMMSVLRDSGVIDAKRVNLKDSYKYFFGEDFEGAHTSMGDVRATEKLYSKIIDFLKSKV